MAEWGFVSDDFVSPPVEVWPDNWQAVCVFSKLGTQWKRAGMQGAATGLDYAALPAVFQLCGVKRKDWPEMFDDIRVMERAALEILSADSNAR